MNEDYVPKKGDKVKINSLHSQDAYAASPDKVLGRAVTIVTEPRETFSGCYTFSCTQLDENSGHHFFAAMVEPFF